MDCPVSSAGATMLPTLRMTKRSPGSVDTRRLGTTRLSAQVMNRQSGDCPLARRANVAR